MKIYFFKIKWNEIHISKAIENFLMGVNLDLANVLKHFTVFI